MATPTILASTISSVNDLTAGFSSLTTSASHSCDIMGTIGSLTDKLIHTITDPITGAITTVVETVEDVFSEVRAKLTDCFSGSSSVINSIKGHIQEGQQIASEIAAKVNQLTAQAMAQLQSLMDSVNSAIQSAASVVQSAMASVVSAINDMRDCMADVVYGIRVGTCSVINSVLAGTADDAFANITNGATDATLKTLGAAKDVWNTGGNSLKDITSKISEVSGVGGAVTGARTAALSMQGIVSNVVPQVGTIGANLASMRSILAGV